MKKSNLDQLHLKYEFYYIMSPFAIIFMTHYKKKQIVKVTFIQNKIVCKTYGLYLFKYVPHINEIEDRIISI